MSLEKAYLWRGVGRAFYTKKRYTKAIEYFDKALALNKNYKEAWNDKGNALFCEVTSFQSKCAEAAECYDKAIALDKNYKGGKCAEAAEYYDKAIALDKNYKESKYAEAAECYDKAIALDENYKEAWYNKGKILKSQGKYAEAIACYNKAIMLDNTYKQAWNNKGEILEREGEYTKAIACYDKAIALDKNFIIAWYNKGSALNLSNGQENEVTMCFLQALILDKVYKEKCNEKADALLNKGRYKEAFTYFDKVRKLDLPLLPPLPQKPPPQDKKISNFCLAGCLEAPLATKNYITIDTTSWLSAMAPKIVEPAKTNILLEKSDETTHHVDAEVNRDAEKRFT